jgi:hypothetical protein
MLAIFKPVSRRMVQMPTRRIHQPSLATAQTHPDCVFNRLPYDVRFAVYSYLEPDLALAPHKHCLAFILSCHQAKEEIEQLAHARLEQVCTVIEETSGVHAVIEIDPHNPRDITVELPCTAFDDFSTPGRAAKWKRDVLVNLHPLFAHPFDMLRIHVATEHDSFSQAVRTDFESMIRLLVKDIGVMIDHVNWWTRRLICPQKILDRIEQIFDGHSDQILSPYPSDKVDARRICISWDLRSRLNGSQVLLTGVTWHNPSTVACRCGRDRRPFEDTRASIARWRKARKERECNPLDPPNFVESICYQLQDIQHLVGEIGLVSTMRWPLSSWDGQSVAGMVERYDIHHARDILSAGLGKAVEWQSRTTAGRVVMDGENHCGCNDKC